MVPVPEAELESPEATVSGLSSCRGPCPGPAYIRLWWGAHSLTGSAPLRGVPPVPAELKSASE